MTHGNTHTYKERREVQGRRNGGGGRRRRRNCCKPLPGNASLSADCRGKVNASGSFHPSSPLIPPLSSTSGSAQSVCLRRSRGDGPLPLPLPESPLPPPPPPLHPLLLHSTRRLSKQGRACECGVLLNRKALRVCAVSIDSDWEVTGRG